MKFTTRVLVTEWNKHDDHEAIISIEDIPKKLHTKWHMYRLVDYYLPYKPKHESTFYIGIKPGELIIEPVHSCVVCSGRGYHYADAGDGYGQGNCNKCDGTGYIKTGEIYVLTPEEYAKQTKEEE